VPHLCRIVAGSVALLTLSVVPAGEPDGSLPQLLNQLDTARFEDRVAAERQLDGLSPEQIRELAELGPAIASAETATRILHGLDRLYAGDDERKSAAASDVLETFIASDRAILAEEASWLLIRHWKRRQELAVAALRKHGAQVVLPETIARVRQKKPAAAFGKPDMPQVQIFIASEWDGSEAGRRILDRMPGLAQQLMTGGGNNRLGRRGFLAQRGQRPPVVTIFLVAGHPLSPGEAGRLKGAFGASVQDRGETMLGITANAGVAAGGCLVKTVVEHGSGAEAGLKPGDKITHVEGVQINSFDDLVQELRKYSAGDTVTVGHGEQPPGQPRDGRPVHTLKVTLRSWSDYARAINADVTEEEVPPAKTLE